MHATFCSQLSQIDIGQSEAQRPADGKGNDVVGKTIPTERGGGADREASSACTTPIELASLSISSRLGEFLAATSIALHPGPFLQRSPDAVSPTFLVTASLG